MKNIAFIVKGADVYSEPFYKLPYNADELLKKAIKDKVKTIVSTQELKKKIPNNILFIDANNIKAVQTLFNYSIPEKIIGVTGSYGKGSTLKFLSQFLKNHTYLVNGSVKTYTNENTIRVPHDRGLPIGIYHMLSQVDNMEYFLLEAFCDKLSKKSYDTLPFFAVGFTNLYHNHMEIFKNMNDYVNSKKRLFSEIQSKYQIINGSTAWGKSIIDICTNPIPYGKSPDFSLYYTKNYLSIEGKKIDRKNMKIFADFLIEDILCAAGLALVSGISLESVIEKIPKLEPLKKRFERTIINNCQVIYDLAWSPFSLHLDLTAIQKLKPKKVVVVYSAKSRRPDQYIREEVQLIKRANCDLIITTSNCEKKRAYIKSVAPEGIEIPDRKEALWEATRLAGSDGIVLCIVPFEEDITFVK